MIQVTMAPTVLSPIGSGDDDDDDDDDDPDDWFWEFTYSWFSTE